MNTIQLQQQRALIVCIFFYVFTLNPVPTSPFEQMGFTQNPKSFTPTSFFYFRVRDLGNSEAAKYNPGIYELVKEQDQVI